MTVTIEALLYGIGIVALSCLLFWLYSRKKRQRESDEARWILATNELPSPIFYRGDSKVVEYQAGEFIHLLCPDPQNVFVTARWGAVLGFVCAGVSVGLLVFDMWEDLFVRVAAIVTFGHPGPSVPSYIFGFRIFIAGLGLLAFLLALRLWAVRPQPRMVIIDGQPGRIALAPLQAGGQADIYEVGNLSTIFMREHLGQAGPMGDPSPYDWSIQFLGPRKPVVLTQSEANQDREESFRNAASLVKAIASILHVPIQVQRCALISGARKVPAKGSEPHL